jgi:hypothetical protein
MPCAGDPSEKCAAPYFVSVLTFMCKGKPDPLPPLPPLPPPPPPPRPPPPPTPRPPFKRGQKNVLFVMSDDMRAELGVYGSEHMHTPNFDAFGASATVFERGYIAVSVCMPSRTAGLTGRRPDSTRNYELRNDEYHRNVVNATTIPQFFKERGCVWPLLRSPHFGPEDRDCRSFHNGKAHSTTQPCTLYAGVQSTSNGR